MKKNPVIRYLSTSTQFDFVSIPLLFFININTIRLPFVLSEQLHNYCLDSLSLVSFMNSNKIDSLDQLPLG